MVKIIKIDTLIQMVKIIKIDTLIQINLFVVNFLEKKTLSYIYEWLINSLV
jgi:hypothetical protein